MLRLFAAGIKYLSIVSLPFLFDQYDLAVIAILLGIERFISFVFSLEAHGVFNREIIQRNSNNIIVNSQHISVLFYGGFASICLAILYAFAEDLLKIWFPIIVICCSSGIMNELTRKAQAYGKVGPFSILSFIKSFIFAASVLIVGLYSNVGSIGFTFIWACVSMICVLISAYRYRSFFRCDILLIRNFASDGDWLLSQLFYLRHFLVLGIVTFGIALLERTLIRNYYDASVLSSYFIIQSIILSCIALFDIFLWGPNYGKIINEAGKDIKFVSFLTEISFKMFSTFAIAIFSLLFILSLLISLSVQYYELINSNIFWLLSLSFLLVLVPLDTLAIYYCHGKRLDNYNSLCGILGALSMFIFLFNQLPAGYLSGGIIIFYIVSFLTKLLILARDRLLF